MWIVELEKDVWIAPWSGDPGRSLVQSNAQRFRSEYGARQALVNARQYRPFVNAVIWQGLNAFFDPVDSTSTMFFAFDDDPESDTYNGFLVVKQDYWEQYGHLDDQHIGGMPEGFNEACESVFEYDGTPEEGRELLLTMGYKEEKKLLP